MSKHHHGIRPRVFIVNLLTLIRRPRTLTLNFCVPTEKRRAWTCRRSFWLVLSLALALDLDLDLDLEADLDLKGLSESRSAYLHTYLPTYLITYLII